MGTGLDWLYAIRLPRKHICFAQKDTYDKICLDDFEKRPLALLFTVLVDGSFCASVSVARLSLFAGPEIRLTTCQ